MDEEQRDCNGKLLRGNIGVQTADDGQHRHEQKVQHIHGPHLDGRNHSRIALPFSSFFVFVFGFYSSCIRYPLGLFFCQFQASQHMSSRLRRAFQPSRRCALLGLA